MSSSWGCLIVGCKLHVVHYLLPMDGVRILGYATINSTLHLVATYLIINTTVLSEDYQVLRITNSSYERDCTISSSLSMPLSFSQYFSILRPVILRLNSFIIAPWLPDTPISGPLYWVSLHYGSGCTHVYSKIQHARWAIIYILSPSIPF